MAGMDSGYSSMRELVDNIFPVVSRRGDTGGVSRPFGSWNRSILTEIYLCHACLCQEIEDGNTRAPGRRRWHARDGRPAHRRQLQQVWLAAAEPSRACGCKGR
eukprot:COSAG01_NODE_2874_length_6937_cov_4.473823_9_plen_103_part_00